MTPYISIIVPVYQVEKTLDRCVRSVLDQTFSDFEVILVDDGSQDRSGSICDAYAAADSRVQVIHQSNSGVSSARNKGIASARGTYLLFLDSDDALAAEALSIYAAASENGKYDAVIGGLSVLENGIEVRRIGFDTEICAGSEIWNQICCDSVPFGYAGGKLIRRNIVIQNALAFNLAMQSQEDLDFFLSVYGFSEAFHVIPQCVYQYYYAPPKRTSPTWDFIANQLKLLRTAQRKCQLSPQALACVQQRTLSLLYTSLYIGTEQGTFREMVERMNCVEGLRDFLIDVPAKGEHRIVAKNFASGNYRRIEVYFRIRNQIRDVFRWIRKK